MMVSLPEGFAFQQDYEIWGPVNLIYRPFSEEAPSIQAEVLNRETEFYISKDKTVNNLVRDIIVHKDYSNLLLLSTPSSSSCMHVVDGSFPVYTESESLFVERVAKYSNVDRILQAGSNPRPSLRVFGNEPAHSWCYFYQKAAYARQIGDWGEVARTYDQIVALGLEAADKSEMIPFIEGLASTNRIDDARFVFNKNIKGSGYLRYTTCRSLVEYSDYPTGYNYDVIYDVLCDS
jgi:hypothetical protein